MHALLPGQTISLSASTVARYLEMEKGMDKKELAVAFVDAILDKQLIQIDEAVLQTWERETKKDDMADAFISGLLGVMWTWRTLDELCKALN